MGLGVLDDKHLEHVPGTALLAEVEGTDNHRHGILRHAKGRDSDIVLVPQPSRSPNDPLRVESQSAPSFRGADMSAGTGRSGRRT